jgi:TolB-like protein
MNMKQRNRGLPFTALLALVLHVPVWAQQGTLYTGSGAEGLSVAVLVPEAKGIDAGEAYLPTMAQGVLVGDFTRFSKMRVIDRQALDKVIAEGESGYYADENNFVRLGKAADVQYVLSGTLQKTGAGFLLQFKVTEAATGASKAAYSGNCATAELENFSALKKASEDLLGQLGVSLTDAGKNALRGTSEQNIKAETALAKGITAQRGGTVVEALSYYYEAAKFDPSLAEAASRSSVLTADIQAGSIGQNVRNELQRRDAWLKVLREAAAFYQVHRPYEILYDPTLIQGKTDYKRETVDISFRMILVFQESAWRILNELKQGLEKTGKSRDWDLRSWPDGGEAQVLTRNSYEITAALVNEDGKTIGNVKALLRSVGELYQSIVRDTQTLTFAAVDANEITDKLTVVITSVNGMDPKTAGERGYINIYSDDTLSLTDKFSVFYDQRYEGIGIAGYRGSTRDPVIPSRMFQWPVRYIGNRAFNQKGLTGVTIPDGITSIGDYAFTENSLTSIVIPDSVTSIGRGAFSNNNLTRVVIPNSVTSIGRDAFRVNGRLTSIIIPNSVTSIGEGAFAGNELTSITIGNNVSIDLSSGDSGYITNHFRDFYNENGKKAGTYTRKEWTWSYQPPR